MGIHLVDALGVGDADHIQHLQRALFDFVLVQVFLVVELDDLVHLVADTKDRVQSGHGFLEDHGDIVATNLLHLFQGHFCNIIGLVAHVDADFALDNLALRTLQKLHQRQAGHGLAAAGLADNADGLAGGNLEGHAVDGLDRSHISEEVGV